jgi:hypothetical protein
MLFFDSFLLFQCESFIVGNTNFVFRSRFVGNDIAGSLMKKDKASNERRKIGNNI